ncbi:MAG: hypothetical protein AVO35_04405 [Candidatus Aegiribacteria sp. MLS_C]|nr:MAG: hypothetical protein AVO35_04405 [Candidatus Aegiribacteria sp. MLS_C]
MGCGETRTSGFYAGATTTRTSRDTTSTIYTASTFAAAPDREDTLLNETFDGIMAEPFGPSCHYPIYNGSMHIDNSVFDDPVILLSTAGLVGDGLVEAQFDIVDAPSHCVVGLVLRAESTQDFLLAGANSRGQYTVQRSLRGLWLPVMGMDPFESSRLLPYGQPGVEVSALVHGSYVDLRINGQLIQVVRTDLPATGQVGVFVDGYANVNLDRLTVVPSE